MTVDQSYTLPMEGAQAFWNDKLQLSPGQFAKLSDEAKLRAFAVSGIAKGDELNSVFTALQKAIDRGDSFAKFKKECGEIFERRGWTGKRSWRVDNIYRTNIQTAYNVGRYQQLKEEMNVLPYWQYDAVNDKRSRPTHLAMDGRVWPADHPVWNTWYPPNGYRCRCSVIGLTKGQVERRKIKVEQEDITEKIIEPISPVSGEKMPAHQMLPDIGFEHHPGKLVWGGVVEKNIKNGHLFKPLDGLLGPDGFRRQALRNVRPAAIANLEETMLLPAKQADELYIKAFKDRYGEELVVKDAAGEPVILSLRSFQVYKEPGKPQAWKFSKPGHGEIIPLLQEAIEHPYEIWLTPQKNASGKVRLSRRYISLWKTEDKKRVGGLFVFEVNGGVFQGVTAYVPKKKKAGEQISDVEYVERQRKGVLLYPRR